jgi:enoyl-CoA hydratase
MSVTSVQDGPVMIVKLDRPDRRNAVDGPTARALSDAFRRFDSQEGARVAVLHGGECFCAGADLKAIAHGGDGNSLSHQGDAPMGPTRMLTGKPVIAAIEGYAVAGGLELALWCDLRVVAENAVMGVFCRRFGVPLIDGGTVRLPRMIGMGRALDLILTGRAVAADEAMQIGLANRVTPPGKALEGALELARQLAVLPQECMLGDRASVYEQWNLDVADAMAREFSRGLPLVGGKEMLRGLQGFSGGGGRHGSDLGEAPGEKS